jgi:hypothetical protein
MKCAMSGYGGMGQGGMLCAGIGMWYPGIQLGIAEGIGKSPNIWPRDVGCG